ncbi:putative aliphatic sulfonates transport permease protein SsuC [Pelotomaculum propionicicum]|uniref:Putative aliphatic sulfonates transport permease protein SsuC n=2 Tax=Pelotomaculum propionicicum TaxID=258475 RepID=A0A4Y7RSX4_9FIRM|nr:putative aliphatic sulfonates transport permease protein SsuC [Pelotomaculum propionicicum]
MEPVGDKARFYNSRNTRLMREKVMGAFGQKQLLYRLITIAFVFGVWQLAANHYHSEFMMPSPWKTMVTFTSVVQDPEVVKNLMITLKRVLTGFLYALMIGVPLGFLMGYSKTALQLFDPLIDSLRQIPIMAWVPLTIVWFGLGDGPTIFLIAFAGVFPIVLNTVAGVQNISRDYYNAARSMGAGPWSIFAHIIVPASLPDILIGGRVAVGLGWMSVI